MTSAPLPETDAAAVPDARPVPKRKRWLVYGVLAVLVGGHLVDIALRREHWPFSNYPMWSRASTVWKASDVRVHGIVAGGAGKEVELTSRHITPLPRLQMTLAMRRAVGQADAGKPELLHRRARDLMRYYESLREAGRHDGPPIEGLRVYEYEWDVNVKGEGADRPRIRLVASEPRGTGPTTTPSAAASAGQAEGAVTP
jgi:hypothetical protein